MRNFFKEVGMSTNSSKDMFLGSTAHTTNSTSKDRDATYLYMQMQKEDNDRQQLDESLQVLEAEV